MQHKKKTLYLFIFAQCSVMVFFLLILILSLLRLINVKEVLEDISSNSIPTLSKATEITREVQHLISLSARLTSSESQSARRIIKTQLDETIQRLTSSDSKLEQSDKYLATQLNVLTLEIQELNELVRQRIDVEKEVRVEREVLFAYLNDILESRNKQYDGLQSSKKLVPLVLQIAQINQQFQLHELRKLEDSIEKGIAALRASPLDRGSSELVNALEEGVLGQWGMIDKQANVMRIRGRSRGRGSFVEHLAEEVASNIEFRASSVTKATSTYALDTNIAVSKQITLSVALSLIVLTICCAIIFYIYKRIILRLIALTNLVEENSDEVTRFEGNDEISRLAKTFALYFERVKSQEEQLIRLSLSDPLTQIPNRRAFEMEMEKAMAMSKRHNWPLTMILLDVDSFKLYNDNYGHTKGDECLKAVAKELNDVVARNTDFCARYGGEEFVAILPDTDEKGARIKAEEIRKAIEELKIDHSKSPVSTVITASLGIATVDFSNHQEWTLTAILNAADKALYDAKSSGRNRCVYTSLP
ncbi:GGDEF domain-containing protein [Alteromonas portus]|uniref:diguanylate cyclase n=1 Tax=Alteromonas portus TaxID=2565549 RepID=A0A4U0ZLB6_9ALTE|nr:GGDEF domain-containing protein [Alteromonas portus]TKB04602.1 GGDEF domain-containing protein [Alteromonas portus]